MKKLFFLALSVLIFGGVAANAQNQTTTQAPPAALKWVTTKIDMGKIPQGTPATVTFDFTNNGRTPVVLKNVQPSCGCTTSDYTKEPVAAGKKGYVKATYNAANPGSFSKSVTVTTDSGETAVLIITGEVVVKQQPKSN
jgi:hypothetical protein